MHVGKLNYFNIPVGFDVPTAVVIVFGDKLIFISNL